jgi:hypothetical protein
MVACFKQWAVKGFLVAEKESGTNVHKQFKNVHGVTAVDERTDYQWASITAGSQKGQADLSDTTVFGMEKGGILVEIMIQGQTINSDLNTPTV